MKFMGIMMFPTESVGIEANIIPMVEKAMQERRIPRIKAKISTIWRDSQKIASNNGIKETASPNMKPAITFPKSTDSNDIGADRYLSNVFMRRSRGITTGPTVEDAQNIVWERRIGISRAVLNPLPTVKVKNKAKGKRTPNINVGGFR